MAKENRRVLEENTPSSSSSGPFTWRWDRVETRSLMTVMGVRVIEENTIVQSEPTERSPPHKQPRHRRGKENREQAFLVSKRFRKSGDCLSGAVCSWENLPDELLLVIFHSLSLPHLVTVSRVSKRWHRLAFDKSLWYSVDLSKVSLPLGTVGQVLAAGVVVLKTPCSFLGDPVFKDDRPLCVQHMDLSNSVVTSSALFQIIHRCHRLLSLSLEGLTLSDDVIRAIGQNEDLLRLNLSTCSHFGPDALAQMLNNCRRLQELNVSWCKFSSQHIQAIVTHIPDTVTQLNLSGYRQTLRNSDVEAVCRRCPRITNLDMSDSTMLTPSCFSSLHRLAHLQHLGLSRCHEIPPAALVDLVDFASLQTLNIYGLVRDSLVNVKEMIPQIKINTFPLTTIGRPTLGSGKIQTIWGNNCRLDFHSL